MDRLAAMKRILSEPLLHFLVLGAALFGLYAVRSPGENRETIVVSAGRIESLATTFTRTWQRPPTEQELKGLIDDYVVEEILSREAIRLGLDRDDTVIRRRLRQKMEFVTEDLTAMQPPTNEELQAYFRQHTGAFLEDTRYTFQQVFIGEGGEPEQRRTSALLARLNSAADIDPLTVGDRLMIPPRFSDVTPREVDSQFGKDFAEQLDGAEIGVWSGPFFSGYGAHLVQVTERIPPRTPSFDEVRDDVERELMSARRNEMKKRMLESLLERYEVVVESPGDPMPAVSTAAEGSR